MDDQCVEKCEEPYNYFYNDTQICSDHCENSEPVLVEEQLYECQQCIEGYKFNEQLKTCKIDHDNNKSLDKTAIILLSTLILIIVIVLVIMVIMRTYKIKRQKQLKKIYKMQELSDLALNDSTLYLKQFLPDTQSTSWRATVSSDSSAIEISEKELDKMFRRKVKNQRSSDIIIYDPQRDIYY